MSDRNRGGRDAELPWATILWLIVVIVWATRAPFLPRLTRWELVLSPAGGLLEMAGNLLLFAPLAFILARWVARRFEGRGPLLALGAALVVACALVEAGQIALRNRLISPYDFGWNVAGASLGTWAGARVRRAGHPARRLLDRALAVFLALAWTGIVVFFAVRASSAARGLELEGWDPAFRIVAADEVGGARSYVGEVDSARICAPLSRAPICASAGAGDSARRELAEAAEAAQFVQLEAFVRSRSDHQTGPTRIVTFSAGPSRRNATLGQSGDDLILRLRTPPGGPNGTNVTFRLPDAIPRGQWIPVEGRFSDGRVTLRAGSGPQAKAAVFEVTTKWLWTWIVAGKIDPNHTGQPIRAALVGLTVLLLPVGLLAARTPTLARRWRIPVAAAGSCALLFAAASFALFGAIPVSWLGVSGVVGAAGGWLGLHDRRVWGCRDSGGGGA